MQHSSTCSVSHLCVFTDNHSDEHNAFTLFSSRQQSCTLTLSAAHYYYYYAHTHTHSHTEQQCKWNTTVAAAAVPVRTPAWRAGDRAAVLLGCGDMEPHRVAPVCLTGFSMQGFSSFGPTVYLRQLIKVPEPQNETEKCSSSCWAWHSMLTGGFKDEPVWIFSARLDGLCRHTLIPFLCSPPLPHSNRHSN